MELSEARGKVMAIGGGDVTGGDAPLLKEFVKLARGPRARVVVMTVATDDPAAAKREYESAFKRLGIDDVKTVDVSARSDAEDEKSLAAIEAATGLFFTGGDQRHITSLMGGTPMQELMFRRYGRGLVIGGTSAGAAMMSNSMLLSGASDESPRAGSVEIGPGMDLIVGTMIDTHFSQRGRFGRLLAAVAHYPQDLGLGIDEETGVIVNRNELEVFGRGAVTVIDGGAMTHTSLPYADDDDALALYGIRVHVLAAGSKFDLAKREPVIGERTPKKRARAAESGRPDKSDEAGKSSKGAAARPRRTGGS